MQRSTQLRLLFMSSIPRWGGGERWLVDAAAGLAARGHHVLLAARPGARLLDRARDAGVQTRQLPMGGELDPRALLGVSRLLAAHRPHAVFVNLDKELRYVCLCTRLGPRPLIFQRRGSDARLKDGRLQRTIYTRYVTQLVTNSATLARKRLAAEWLPAGAVRVIRNGVQTSREPEVHDRDALRRRLLLPRRRALVLHVGELEPRKGQATTLRALAELAAHAGNDGRRVLPTVAFVGTGGEEVRLRDLCHALGVQDHVLWIGFRTDVRDYLAAADMLVLPSQHEGVPWTILEAMAVGLPVIASAVSGIPEVVADGRNGLLVPPDAPAALAAAIRRLLADAALAERLGRAGYETVRDGWDTASMLDDLECLVYAQLLRREAARRRSRQDTQRPQGRPAALHRPRAALFVDRDDTLVCDAGDRRDTAAVRLVPGAARGLRWLRDAGVPVLVVSNQSGIALGLHSESDLDAGNARLRELLRQEGADVDAVYFCPHHPDHGPPCDCRKPEPGLLLRAAREHDVDLGASLMVGDAPRDLQAGVRAGTQSAGFAAPGKPPRLPAGTLVYARWTSLVRDFLRALYARVPFEPVSASAAPEADESGASAEAAEAHAPAEPYSLRMKTASS